MCLPSSSKKCTSFLGTMTHTFWFSRKESSGILTMIVASLNRILYWVSEPSISRVTIWPRRRTVMDGSFASERTTVSGR